MNKKYSADTTQEASFGAVEKSSTGKGWKRPFFGVPFWHSSGQFCQTALSSLHHISRRPMSNHYETLQISVGTKHLVGFRKKEFSKSRGIGCAPEHTTAREGRADRSWQNVFQTCLDFVVYSCLTILNITAGATKWCQHNNSYILQPAGITHIHSSKDGGARAATNKKKSAEAVLHSPFASFTNRMRTSPTEDAAEKSLELLPHAGSCHLSERTVAFRPNNFCLSWECCCCSCPATQHLLSSRRHSS